MKESACELVELRGMKESVCASGEPGHMQESVCESGEPGSMQGSVCESGKPGSMEESVCDSGKSVSGLSLRARRARAGGDHDVAQLCTRFGNCCNQIGTKLEPHGTMFRTKLEPVWDQYGTNLGLT